MGLMGVNYTHIDLDENGKIVIVWKGHKTFHRSWGNIEE